MVAADEISSVWYQRVKLVHGADGASAGDVSTTNPYPVQQSVAATVTNSNVNDTASSTTLLASNSSRRGASFFNDSTSILYLKLGATASTTSYTVQLAPGDYYELMPPIYTGVIDGIWSADAAGAVRISEHT